MYFETSRLRDLKKCLGISTAPPCESSFGKVLESIEWTQLAFERIKIPVSNVFSGLTSKPLGKFLSVKPPCPTQLGNNSVKHVTAADGDLLLEGLRYMYWASAVYVGKFYRLMNESFTDVLRNPFPATLEHIPDFDPKEDVLITLESNAGVLFPAHLVVYKASRKEIVVAVRGTYETQDVLTSLGAEELNLEAAGQLMGNLGITDGFWTSYVHSSFFATAVRLCDHLFPMLNDFAAKQPHRPVTRIVLSGHSLGGGIAVYLKKIMDITVHPAIPILCFNYGCPGVMCPRQITLKDPRIFSFVNDQDWCARVSYGHIKEFLHEKHENGMGSQLVQAGQVYLIQDDIWLIEADSLERSFQKPYQAISDHMLWEYQSKVQKILECRGLLPKTPIS